MSENVFIFGAHSRAQTMGVYINTSEEETCVKAYLVDDMSDNPLSIDGVDVMTPDKVDKDLRELPVFLAIRGVYHSDVEKRLREFGYTDIRPVTVDLDAQYRKAYFRKYFQSENRSFLMIDDFVSNLDREKPEVKIYVVCSAFDKPLSKDEYLDKEYESRIQVGTALTDHRISNCDHFDDEEDNISSLNKKLCEETALYWLWKHAKEDYIGLVHYRRHFILPDDWIDRMIRNNIDVILPIPIYVRESVENNYRKRHVSADWDVMLDVLREKSKMSQDVIQSVFNANMYFPLNIFVMKREVLNDYCEWLFPILFNVIEIIGDHEDSYQRRYPAFMAERLLTLYFEAYRKKYKIVYSDKGFLQ